MSTFLNSFINALLRPTDSDRLAEYDLKLMDIDSDTLGIPDTEYDACVTMPSAEFSRIVRDLSQLGESVRIEVSKEGVRFASEGEAANGSVLLKGTEGVESSGKMKVKKEEGEEKEEDEQDEDEDEDEDGEKKKKIRKEKVKKEKDEEDGEDVDMDDNDDDGEFKADDEDGEEEQDADEEGEEGEGKKRKRKQVSSFRLRQVSFSLVLIQ